MGVATARDEDEEQGIWDHIVDVFGGRRVGYIMTIGVHENYRKCGLGVALLEVRLSPNGCRI